MKERGSQLKTTSNLFMESVLETCEVMNFPNALCTLVGWPFQKSALKLRMLPCRYLDKMGHKWHSSGKGIISTIPQDAKSPLTLSRKSVTTFPTSCALKSTLCLKALLKVSSTAVKAAKKSLTTVKMKMSASKSCMTK